MGSNRNILRQSHEQRDDIHAERNGSETKQTRKIFHEDILHTFDNWGRTSRTMKVGKVDYLIGIFYPTGFLTDFFSYEGQWGVGWTKWKKDTCGSRRV